MILNTVDKSIQVVAAEPGSLPFYISYSDTESLNDEDSSTGTVSDTPTDVLPAPNENTSLEKSYLKKVKYLSIANTTTENKTLYFNLVDGPVVYRLFTCVIKPQWTVEWDENTGWKIYNEQGNDSAACCDTTRRGILGQYSVPATTLTDLYIVPEGFKAEVESIFICNRNGVSAVNVRISIAINGEADSPKQYLYYDLAIPANDTFLIDLQNSFGMGQSDIFRAYAGTADISITLNGKEIPISDSNES